MVLHVTASGELVLPAELVRVPPYTPVEAERHGDVVVLKPACADPTGDISTETLFDLHARPKRPSMRSLPTLSGRFVNGAETFRREDLYGDDGR